MWLGDLMPASFRGVRFLVPKDTGEEGRNSIKHEYPDASYRYVEDNGYIPPEFSITAILHGQDVASQFRRLRSALNRPGPGTLKHPYLGAQFVQVMGPYKYDRQDSDSGVMMLEIKFAVTGPPIFPGLVSGVAAVVSGLAGTAVTTLFSAFSATYGSGGSTLSSRSTISQAVSSIAGALDRAFPTAASRRLIDQSASLADDPSRAAPLFVSAFRDPFQDDAIATETLWREMKAISDVSAAVIDEAALIPVTTQDLAERQAALDALGSAGEIAAFAGLCEAAAVLDYITGEQVEDVESDLIDRFDRLQERPLAGTIQDDLRALFIATSDVLSAEAVRLPNVVETSTAFMPASVLTYQLYASDTDLQRIVDLNVGRNPLLYNGPVNVLSQDA